MIAIVGLLFCGMTLVKIIRLSIHVRQCYITCDTREAVFKEFILNPLPIISLAFVHPKLQASGGISSDSLTGINWVHRSES